MTFPPAQLKPLDLTRTPRASVRKLAAADVSPTSRLAGDSAPPTQHDQLVGQTQKWVSQTFFGTLLKQMADSTFKSDLFSGGRGGEAFSSLYHQQLADRMARGAGDPLVQSIVRRIEAQAAYRDQATKSKANTNPKASTNPKRVGDVPIAARA